MGSWKSLLNQNLTSAYVLQIENKIIQRQNVYGRIMTTWNRYVFFMHIVETYHRISFTKKRCKGICNTLLILRLWGHLIPQCLAVYCTSCLYLYLMFSWSLFYYCDAGKKTYLCAGTVLQEFPWWKKQVFLFKISILVAHERFSFLKWSAFPIISRIQSYVSSYADEYYKLAWFLIFINRVIICIQEF